MGPSGVGEVMHAYSLFIPCSPHKNFTDVLYLAQKSMLTLVLEYIQGTISQTDDYKNSTRYSSYVYLFEAFLFWQFQ